MKINGYQIDGTKEDYINILVQYANYDIKELNNKTFKEVVIEYCFLYNPLVLSN